MQFAPTDLDINITPQAILATTNRQVRASLTLVPLIRNVLHLSHGCVILSVELEKSHTAMICVMPAMPAMPNCWVAIQIVPPS